MVDIRKCVSVMFFVCLFFVVFFNKHFFNQTWLLPHGICNRTKENIFKYSQTQPVNCKYYWYYCSIYRGHSRSSIISITHTLNWV